MTEAVISDLARIKALRVISRTSAMRYKGTTLSLPEIARELNVDAILEGSAHLVGERVRLNVQLIAARTDETLWAERYDRQLEDVLDLQSELAEKVAGEIAVQLTPSEATHLARRHEVNPEAHLEYLKSRHSAMTGSREGVDLGLRHASAPLTSTRISPVPGLRSPIATSFAPPGGWRRRRRRRQRPPWRRGARSNWIRHSPMRTSRWPSSRCTPGSCTTASGRCGGRSN